MAAYELCIDRSPVTVALVNNMPDSAFVDTEHQFRRAAVAAHPAPVEFDLYAIAAIPRSEAIAAEIQSRYRGLDELWDHPPDALIVTGTEPTQGQARDEPYWPYLANLLEWAACSVPTTLLSCLAAHASLLLFDGIERVRRPLKLSGVFEGTVGDRSDPMAAGLSPLVRFPHSRANEVPECALVESGYRIIVGSGPSDAGWTVAAREQGEGLFVLCQGHPEYGALSLLREYRRDVRRSLFGHGGVPYPCVPDGYLSLKATAILREFERYAASTAADSLTVWNAFPYEEVAATVEKTWAANSSALYANWLRLAQAALPARA